MECADCGSQSNGFEMGPKARRVISPPPPPSFRLWIDDDVDSLPPPDESESPRSLSGHRGLVDELRLEIDC